MEVFQASCDEGEVIYIHNALYGRMRFGRCVDRDFGYVGCKTDVLHICDKVRVAIRGRHLHKCQNSRNIARPGIWPDLGLPLWHRQRGGLRKLKRVECRVTNDSLIRQMGILGLLKSLALRIISADYKYGSYRGCLLLNYTSCQFKSEYPDACRPILDSVTRCFMTSTTQPLIGIVFDAWCHYYVFSYSFFSLIIFLRNACLITSVARHWWMSNSLMLSDMKIQ